MRRRAGFQDRSAEEMIANCDVLITRYSSTAFVGLALGKKRIRITRWTSCAGCCPCRTGPLRSISRMYAGGCWKMMRPMTGATRRATASEEIHRTGDGIVIDRPPLSAIPVDNLCGRSKLVCRRSSRRNACCSAGSSPFFANARCHSDCRAARQDCRARRRSSSTTSITESTGKAGILRILRMRHDAAVARKLFEAGHACSPNAA